MANLKNINFMSSERFDELTETNLDELYAVEMDLDTISRNMIPNWTSAGTSYPAGTALPSDGFVYVVAIQSNTYVNGHQIGVHTTSGGSGWTSPNANTSFYARKGDVITGTSFYFKPLGEA